MFWGVINRLEGRQMFIKGSHPPKDKELQVYANEKIPGNPYSKMSCSIID